MFLFFLFFLCLNFPTGETFYRTYLINLERRKDKLRIADFQLKMLNVDYNYIKAVDGPLLKKELNKNPKMKYNDILDIPFALKLNEQNFLTRSNDDAKRLGCLFSHLVTLDKIKNENTTDPVLILEDDFLADGSALETIKTVVSKLPVNWGILYVGHCQSKPPNSCLYVAGYEICETSGLVSCSHALLVNGSEAARKMLAAGNNGEFHHADYFAQKTNLKRFIMYPYVFRQIGNINADVGPGGGTWVQMMNETIVRTVHKKFTELLK